MKSRAGELFWCATALGIKPLYLNESDKHLRFASSLQSILAGGDVDRSIDRVALHHYMTWHAVVPAPHTILEGVAQACQRQPSALSRPMAPPARNNIGYRPSSVRRKTKIVAKRNGATCCSIVCAPRCSARMVCDVPVGVLLSGGVDSSMIVGLLAEQGQTGLSTYSIGFEDANNEKGNEFEYSDLIAKHYGTDHHKIHIPSSEMMGNLPGAIKAMSEPMVSYDNIGFYLLSREVAKSIKVVQSGQGADEVFGGYHWYPPLQATSSPVESYALSFFDRNHKTMASHLNPDYLADKNASLSFVAEHFARPGAPDPVDKALRLDTNVMLVDDPVKARGQYDHGLGA